MNLTEALAYMEECDYFNNGFQYEGLIYDVIDCFPVPIDPAQLGMFRELLRNGATPEDAIFGFANQELKIYLRLEEPETNEIIERYINQ